MKRPYCFSGFELLALVAAVSVVASVTAGLVASIRIRSTEQCTPLPDADFGIEPVRRAEAMAASVHPAPETLQ